MNSQHCIEQWNIFHSKCMEHNCAGAVKLIDGSELHICPLKFNDGKCPSAINLQEESSHGTSGFLELCFRMLVWFFL